MANTISVMTNVLRNAVSKQRIRYKEKGFNLDLAYICDNIIAMGYPADNLESIYRNRLEDVYKFLEENHHNHYKIYNLCIERSYDVNKFHGRVAVYPFEDHNPPTIELIQKFCNDVDSWLKADGLNVAAVHCKAGKGRTGTMICCYLLFSGQQTTAEDALACYDEKRTKDRKGVTIPSQRRYVQYFSKLIQSGLPYEKRTLQFCEIRFIEANLLHSQGTVNCSISVLQDTACALKVQQLRNLTIDFRKSVTLEIQNPSLSIAGDIKVELIKNQRQKIFHFWFNTYFVSDAAVIEGEGSETKLVYTLSKCEIDDAHKDKEHKSFSEDFKVQLVFFVDSSSGRTQTSVGNRISNHRTTQNTRLAQNNYVLPKNNSSGSDLNICDQKSTSSASISTLGGAGLENSNFNVNRVYSAANSSVQPVCVFTANLPETESNVRVVSAPPLPLSPPPLIAQLNDFHQHLLTQRQDYVKTAFTVTSTPNQKQLPKAEYVFSRSHRQQQYVPSACVPRVNSDNTNSFAQSSPQPQSNHTNSNSKSSSISSNSSSSNSGDNEEDWESANSNHIAISTPMHGSSTPLLPSLVCDPSKYVVMQSAKDYTSLHPYMNKYRLAGGGIGVQKKFGHNHALLDDAISKQHADGGPSNNVIFLRQHSNMPLSTTHSAKTMISRNLKPRPRHETT